MKQKIKIVFVGWLLTALVLTSIQPMAVSAATYSGVEANFAVPIVSQTTVPDGYTGIYTTADLDNIRNDLSGKYILMNDVVFSEADFQLGGAFYNEGKGWKSIGNGDLNQPFTGTLDGNGYRISGMTNNNEWVAGARLYLGLFEVSSGIIKNLSMDDVKIANRNEGWTGAIAGKNYGEIDNCMVFNSVHGGGIATGSMTGINYGKLTHLKNFSKVFDMNGPAGGITGINYGTIEYCANMGEVIGPDTHYNGFAGGITSYNHSRISKCYNAGSLVANIVGGIAAANMSVEASIENCFNTGCVQLSKGCDNGSAAGISASSYGLFNCYSTGLQVDPDHSQMNKLGGITTSDRYKVTNCYFLKGTGNIDMGTALTYNQMGSQASYGGFDFTNIWVMSPTLKRPVLRGFLPDTCDISYTLNGGSLSSSAPTAYMDGSNRLLPTPTKKGYAFQGWYGDSALSGNPVTMIPDGTIGDLSYYAKWMAPILTVKSNSYTSIKVSWAAAGSATSYKIYRATRASGTYYLVHTSASTTRSWIDTGRTTGRYYYYKVYPVAGGTTYKFSTYKYAKAVPSTPSVILSKYSPTSIKITWTGVSGASGYQIYRATSATGTYTYLHTASSTSRSWVNTGRTIGKMYYYKVRAYHWEGTTKVYGSFSAAKSLRI